jgi:predicted transcriptional regulator
MKAPVRAQLKVRLDGDLDAAVRRYCAAHNVTQTALVQAALRDYISQASPYEALMKRLDRVSRQLEGQRSMLHLIAEALGGYVMLWLGHTPEVHPENREAARLGAHARYRKWADHVAQRLSGADSFFLQFTPPLAVDAAVPESSRADDRREPA